ncbi:hypothetical protein SAMN04488077_1253 [Roseovarius tolerans]|uniref:Uncharacterized protein n=1 Tax=Roseovarius tolerans TaxID=74031 RepID=A0A1H8IR19_9RHOB|nr:hypothetical protein [Roseovarius tolerans]SEN70839.1 hypothetical protein SAMN04488077_1253 [Roseovarius tolerans]
MTATIQSNLIDETLAGPFGALPLADFLHRHGKRWEGRDLPQNVKKKPSGQCFRNAWELSLRHGLPYCEGYGWDCKLGALPFYHAWNLCPKSGRVIDATWAVSKEALYLGVELTSKQLMRIIDLTGCFEVLQGGRSSALELVEQVLDQKPVSVE